jgi:hypothetical protein
MTNPKINHSRLWIFTAERILTDKEKQMLLAQAQAFAMQWAKHGAPLAAEVFIKDAVFLVFTVNKNALQPSGCSIDALMRAVKDCEEQLGVVLTNRQVVVYYLAGNPQICTLADLPNLYAQGKINDTTPFANHLLSETFTDFAGEFLSDFKTSWQFRFVQ